MFLKRVWRFSGTAMICRTCSVVTRMFQAVTTAQMEGSFVQVWQKGGREFGAAEVRFREVAPTEIRSSTPFRGELCDSSFLVPWVACFRD